MINRRTLLILSIIILQAILLPAPVSAQQEIRFQNIQIELWPEYDRPAVLVIYRGKLDSSVPLPAELTFRLPAATSELNATAVKDTSGSLFSVANKREVRGEWAYITFSTTMPDIQIEFYDALEYQGFTRKYTYLWPADYAAAQVRIELQQPVDVEKIQTIPQLTRSAEQTGNLVYYSTQVGAVEAGETFNLMFEYEKVTDRLTIETLTVQPVEPITPQTDGHQDIQAVAPWVIGGLGFLVIIAGAIWYFSTPKTISSARPVPEKQSLRRVDPELNHSTQEEDAIYCHQCGKRAGPTDRFCRACGTKIRRAEKA